MKSILNHTTKEKAKYIKIIICDVDGVLSDGKIIYDNTGNEIKHFNVKDGFIIKPLQDSGIKIGVITGRKSEVVIKRCNELKMDFHFHGIKDKIAVYESIKSDNQVADSEIAYIGDDLPDLAIIRKCGFGTCPKDANEYLKQYVDLIAETNGGEGVLREIAELILESQSLMGKIVDKFSIFA